VPDAVDPEQLGAVGLAPRQVLQGYLQGLFPMDHPDDDGPVGWYLADPRAVILPAAARVPATVRRMIRRRGYEVRVDSAFGQVVRACGGDRDGEWLTPRLAAAYDALHAVGAAHSVEAWDGARLVGGLFGVWIRGFMTAEIMFHRAPDGGNAALAGLLAIAADRRATLIDVQMHSPHVERFGAREVPHGEFMRLLAEALRPADGP
jgi:leucyl/phenylalanyl-tRNA--protein transferase